MDTRRRHELTDDEAALIDDIEARVADLRAAIERGTKPGRERALAITKLDEARLWAVEGVVG